MSVGDNVATIFGIVIVLSRLLEQAAVGCASLSMISCMYELGQLISVSCPSSGMAVVNLKSRALEL